MTSQLFANIYLNEFDYFVKHSLKIKHYARYTDDFVIVSDNAIELKQLIYPIKDFLHDKLKLSLHPNKVIIRKSKLGIDFLGQILLPHYRLVRHKTRKRIFRKIKEKVYQYRAGLISKNTLNQSLQSYIGTLSHTNSHRLTEELKNQFWFWLSE